MRSSTLSESSTGIQNRDESLSSPQITLPGEMGDEELYLPSDHRAARGVLTGIVLGAGAWGAIWIAAAALWHYRG